MGRHILLLVLIFHNNYWPSKPTIVTNELAYLGIIRVPIALHSVPHMEVSVNTGIQDMTDMLLSREI